METSTGAKTDSCSGTARVPGIANRRTGHPFRRFANVEFPEIYSGLKWNLIYDSDKVIVEVVPRLPLDEIPLGDFNADGALDVGDINLLTLRIFEGIYRIGFDVNGDGYLDFEDRRLWIEEQRRTSFGDSNLDGVFDSGDLVAVFQAGEYEDAIPMNSVWATGDWNGDREFDTKDLIVAFQRGSYSTGNVAAVPEPTAIAYACLVVLTLSSRRLRT
jgi:hypothetical protein